ncbi:MAG: MmgE/PrpD family protein [Deltaproteobacteria bacterium]|nr:MmgE/PrpD family protein [Deltaproteobacteria bacterium]
MVKTRNLADYAVNLKYEDLPDEVIEQAKLLVLHTLGAALAGCSTEQGKRAMELAKAMGGQKDESTILGYGGKAPCVQAGFVNATLADMLDWEDCSWTGHPSAGAIPAALAVGERVKSSGKEIICSIVAGYELYERIAMAMQPSREYDYRNRGWGLTSWNIYASAIPAARLLKLDSDRMENVIGIAGALTHIATPRVQATKTDLCKYRYGTNCMNGITAALIAESGISPMHNFLDGEMAGYWVAFSDKCDSEWYNRNLGEEYLIMETYFKHWPTNMWINQHLDGIDIIMREHGVGPEDVEEIIVRPPVDRRMGFKPEGYESIMDAEYSIPYCISVLMHEPEPGPNWYTAERMKDPKILDFASRVKAEGSPLTLVDAFIQFREGRYPEVSVEVKTKDGRVLNQDVPFPTGHPNNRMTVEEFEARFRRAASFTIGQDKIEKAVDKIMNLEKVEDVSQIADLMYE